ncbi:UPF0175 family protein [Methylobacterium sp. JK268]
MNLTLPIPDDLAERLSSDGEDLARRVLEAFAVEEYRAGRVSLAELRRLLGFGTRSALDAFLKARGIYMDIDLADVDRDRADLANLGF